jgi:hypothetical protein
MSTFQWLLEHDYPLLLLLFIEGMVPYGYGDVTEVPIVRCTHEELGQT